MTRFTVTSEPRGAQLDALLRAAKFTCATAVLVVRDQLVLSDGGMKFLGRLAQLATHKRRGASWPGTTLLSSEADIYEFAFDDAAIDLLMSATDRLYGWQQPDLPEDLCLLTSAGNEWLVTIAHEADAYVDLGEGDLAVLERLVPSFVATLRLDE